MNQLSMGDTPTATKISAEFFSIADHYGLLDAGLRARVQRLPLDSYTEIILGEDDLEICVGGVDADSELAALAEELDVPAPILGAFRASRVSSDSRMVYFKLCFGPGASQPTMHRLALEPWPRVFEALASVPELASSLAELSRKVDERRLCYMLAFTLDPAAGSLVLKAYQLIDQAADEPQGVILQSYRVGRSGLMKARKLYRIGVGWEDVPRTPRWSELARIARTVLPEDCTLALGELRSAEERRLVKLYVFRHDRRMGGDRRLRSSDFFFDEGMRLIQLSRYEDAIWSFDNCIRCQPEHAHSYNNRGFCRLKLSDYSNAVKDCRRAIELDPSIARNNLDLALQKSQAT